MEEEENENKNKKRRIRTRRRRRKRRKGRRRKAGRRGGGGGGGERGRVGEVVSTSLHSAGEDVEKLEHLYIACGNVKCCFCYEKQFSCSSKC